MRISPRRRDNLGRYVQPQPRFLGVRIKRWYGIAKWLSIGGVGGAALITAVATAYKMIYR